MTTNANLGHRARLVKPLLETGLTFLCTAGAISAALRLSPLREPPLPIRGIPIELLDTADDKPVVEPKTLDEAFLFGGRPRAWWANAATEHKEGTDRGDLIRERARANGLVVRDLDGVVRIETTPTLVPRVGGWQR